MDAFSAAKVVYEKYEQEFLVRSLADIYKLSFPCHREETNDLAQWVAGIFSANTTREKPPK